MNHVEGPAFIPSSSPYFDKESPPPKEVGETLFDHTSQFYAWYLSWDGSPTLHKETFSLLSTTMQVAKVSFQGGLYLSSQTEKEALTKLHSLRDALTNGSASSHSIYESISSLLALLTENNPKAKLIAKSTLLEYKTLIYSEKPLPSELIEDYHTITTRLISRITPSLGDLDAEKLAREITKLLDSSQDPGETLLTLNDLIAHWP